VVCSAPSQATEASLPERITLQACTLSIILNPRPVTFMEVLLAPGRSPSPDVGRVREGNLIGYEDSKVTLTSTIL